MRGCSLGLSFLLVCACGPGEAETGAPETGEAESGETESEAESEASESETEESETEESESETETGETPCIPGTVDCECLPDGTCISDDGYLGCNSANECHSCGFEDTFASPACRVGECPTDCLVTLTDYGFGPYPDFLSVWVQLEVDDESVIYVEDCGAESGWTWIVPGAQLELCGDSCDGWMAPPSEGSNYTIELGCPPGG